MQVNFKSCKLIRRRYGIARHQIGNRKNKLQTRTWADAQRDGCPDKYRWRPLFHTAVWLTPTAGVPCSNAAKMRNPLKLAGVPQTNETIAAASGLKFAILWGRVEEVLLLNKFLPDC